MVGVILLGLSIRGGIDSVRYIENSMSTETITETTKNISTDTVEYKMATIDNGHIDKNDTKIKGTSLNNDPASLSVPALPDRIYPVSFYNSSLMFLYIFFPYANPYSPLGMIPSKSA